MARYQVHVFCNECSETHPMGITIELENGPVKQTAIGDLYHGKELPESIGKLINNIVTCPKTGNKFIQEDNNQIFLVPIE